MFKSAFTSCQLCREDESGDGWVEVKWSQDETAVVRPVAVVLLCEFVRDGLRMYGRRGLRYYLTPEWLAATVLLPRLTRLAGGPVFSYGALAPTSGT